MGIKNTVSTTLSVVQGTLASNAPSKVDTGVLLSATAAPGLVVTKTTHDEFSLGGSNAFGGILLANQRVLHDTGLFEKGDVVEACTMGEVSVEINVVSGDTPAVGQKVFYKPSTGALYTSADAAANTEIKGATVANLGAVASNKFWAVISLIGPQV